MEARPSPLPVEGNIPQGPQGNSCQLLPGRYTDVLQQERVLVL